jgi:heme/copper-type cytochrome/quinol oxidase subunit 3
MNAVNAADPHLLGAESIRNLPVDQSRGTGAMVWLIISEVMVFVGLFFSYFYLGHLHSRWPPDSPPHLAIPIVDTCILVVSCLVLWWGQKTLTAERMTRGRGALVVATLLGIAFLILSAIEYNMDVKTLEVTADAYSSIFYVIQEVHAAHLVLGVLMMLYVLALPAIGPSDRPPHRAYFNVALYWYFVTIAWIAVFCILFLSPR